MATKKYPRLATAAERLRWARMQAGFTSPRKAAQAFEWPEDTYRKHETGERSKRGLTEESARKYGRGFDVSWTWLMTGEAPKVSPEGAEMLSLYESADAEDRELARGVLKRRKS